MIALFFLGQHVGVLIIGTSRIFFLWKYKRMHIMICHFGNVRCYFDSLSYVFVLIFGCRTLQKHKLHKFEVACLANLAPADADEAKSLLPRQVSLMVTLAPIAVNEKNVLILLHVCMFSFDVLYFCTHTHTHTHTRTHSLQGRFDDLELNEALDDIRTHMNYQY